MYKAKNIMQKITYSVCTVSMLILLPMMLLTSATVIGRGIFNRPILGAVELSSYMLSVVILLGIAYTQQVKGHPIVTLVTSRLPTRVQGALEVVTYFLSVAIVVVIIYIGWQATFDYGHTTSDVLRIQQFPFRLMVPLGMLLLLFELVIDLFTAIGKLIWPDTGQSGEEM